MSFSLAGADRLPLTGANHPLSREFARWVTAGNALTLFVALAIFGGYVFWQHRKGEHEAPKNVTIVKFTELGVPPSIARPQAPQVAIPNVAPPSIGVPEPVPDVQAQTETIATQAQMSDALAPITASDIGSGDSLVVDTRGSGSPRPDEFVAFDELPVCLSIQPPVYPDLARQAGIDGTVMVQTLVGKDGKVKEAHVVEGPEVLHSAAIASVKTALFKPALQGTRPVEVWVMMPVVFQLQGGG